MGRPRKFPHPNVRMTLPMSRMGVAEVDGRAVSFGKLEQAILEVLLIRGPAWISTSELIDSLWPDPDLEPDDARTSIRVMVQRLRDKSVRIASMPRLGLYRIAQPGDVARHTKPMPKGPYRAKRYATNPPEWFMGRPRVAA